MLNLSKHNIMYTNNDNMKFFKLDNIIIDIVPEYITIQQVKDIETHVNPSLYKHIIDAKQLITKHAEQWDIYKKFTNTYEYIHTPYEYKSYVSKLKPLSRAYYKMVEILDFFEILDPYKYRTLSSFHLAEGPGGFIEALSDKRQHKEDIYYGMTLVDSDSNTPGWKKSQRFLDNHQNVKIELGVDNTGNLMNDENYEMCYQKHKHSMDIITGDGGFDFSSNYNSQEQDSINLIYTQIIYALAMQKKGGCFILKIFDMFTMPTIQLLYLLNSMYTDVYICKPHTSRIANSEKYVVCTNFKKELSYELFSRFKNILHIIYHKKDTQSDYLYMCLNIKIHYEFIKSIQLMNSILGQQQIENINRTIGMVYQKQSKDKLQQDRLRHAEKCLAWCVAHNIPCHPIVKKNIFSPIIVCESPASSSEESYTNSVIHE